MASVTTSRRRLREPQDDLDRRAPALHLVHFGEVSSARQALEGASAAPGTLRTLAAVTDPSRRPPQARAYLDDIAMETHPVIPFDLTHAKFLQNLRTSRRGPRRRSLRRTADHLFPNLGEVPVEVLEWVRMAVSQHL